MKPATLSEFDTSNNITYPLLSDLGITFPVNIPFDAETLQKLIRLHLLMQ